MKTTSSVMFYHDFRNCLVLFKPRISQCTGFNWEALISWVNLSLVYTHPLRVKRTPHISHPPPYSSLHRVEKECAHPLHKSWAASCKANRLNLLGEAMHSSSNLREFPFKREREREREFLVTVVFYSCLANFNMPNFSAYRRESRNSSTLVCHS